jgi:hypothetical protein
MRGDHTHRQSGTGANTAVYFAHHHIRSIDSQRCSMSKSSQSIPLPTFADLQDITPVFRKDGISCHKLVYCHWPTRIIFAFVPCKASHECELACDWPIIRVVAADTIFAWSVRLVCRCGTGAFGVIIRFWPRLLLQPCRCFFRDKRLARENSKEGEWT